MVISMVNIKYCANWAYKWGLLIGGGTYLASHGLREMGLNPDIAFAIPLWELGKQYAYPKRLRRRW
jgi:hypothetical protein